MKKILFLMVALLCCSITSVNAQNIFELQYLNSSNNVITSHTLTRGTSNIGKARLLITNSTGIQSGQYSLKSYSTVPRGLYMQNATPSSVGIINSDNNEMTITLSSSTQTSITVDFEIWVGQCFEFGLNDPNTLTLSIPFSLLDNTSSPINFTGSNNSIIVNKGAFLNYTGANDPDNKQTVAPVNKQVVFGYVFENNSGNTFNGVISFKESSVGDAYDIRSINFYVSNGTGWTLVAANPPNANPLKTFTNSINNSNNISANNNSFVTTPANGLYVDISLSPSQKIKIEEEVIVNGCFADQTANNSSPTIRWGNSIQDLCVSQNFGTIITPNQPAPVFTYNITNATSNHACYGNSSSGPAVHSMSITNNGNDVARNVMLHLNKYSLISNTYIPYNPSDIYIKVTRAGGSTTQHSINFNKYLLSNTTAYDATNTPAFIPPNLVTQHGGSAGNSKLFYMSQFYANLKQGNQPPFSLNSFRTLSEIYQMIDPLHSNAIDDHPFSTECLGSGSAGINVPIVTDLYADEFDLDNDGNADDILSLNPGDKVELFWKEVTCCFKNDVLQPRVFSTNVEAFYNDLCGRKNTGGLLWDESNIAYTINPAPAPTTTAGNPDLCIQTSDGRVERISATIGTTGSFISQPGKYDTEDGDIVFRVYLQNGFDLDRRLTVPSTSPSPPWVGAAGFDNVTDQLLFVENGSTNCMNICANTTTTNPPPCDLTNTMATSNHYVRLRPTSVGNGLLTISPTSVILKASDVNNVQTATGGLPSGTLNDDLIFVNGTNSKYANFLYEIRFSIADLILFYKTQKNILNEPGSPTGFLNDILKESFFDFDIRAYCSSNLAPTYKVVMYHDQCVSGADEYANTSCGAGFTRMQPITSFAGGMKINCPGCTIPGGNIDMVSIKRLNTGLLDADRNRVPDDASTTLPPNHPSLKLFTIGDEMETAFPCYMSDGVALSTGNGILKGELDSRDYKLNTLFVRASMQGGAKLSGASKNMDITYVEVEYKGITLTYSGSSLSSILLNGSSDDNVVIKVKSTDFNSAFISFDAGSAGLLNFKVRYKVGDISRTPTSSGEIKYTPYYSPCSTCTSIDNPQLVNVSPGGPLKAHFTPFTWEKVEAEGINTVWICADFASSFKFYPFIQKSYLVTTDDNCTKSSGIYYEGNMVDDAGPTWTDLLDQEFQAFQTIDLKSHILIPAGYRASRVVVNNHIRIGKGQYTENFTITDLTTINSMVSNNTGNTNYPKVFDMSVRYTPLTSTINLSAFTPAGPVNAEKITLNPTWTGALDLLRGDESYYAQVILFFEKDPSSTLPNGLLCPNIPDYIINTDPTFINKSNLPGMDYRWPTSPAPSTNLEANIIVNPLHTISASGTPYTPLLTGGPGIMKKPAANLTGVNLTNSNVVIDGTQLIHIPVRLNNQGVAPTNNWNTVDYPYLRVYGAALAQGLELVGVYRGNNSIPNPGLTDYYNQSNPTVDGVIVKIDRYSPGTRPSTILENPSLYGGEHDFTLVFQYTNPSNCNPNIPCGTGALSAACLQGTNNLLVEYGWNCGKYPDFTDLANICGKSSVGSSSAPTISYSFSIVPTGLDVTYFSKRDKNATTPYDANYVSHVSSGQTIDHVKPCTVLGYRVNINSCRAGSFSEYHIQFTSLPAGFVADATAIANTVVQDSKTPANNYNITYDATHHYYIVKPQDPSFKDGLVNLNVDFNFAVPCHVEAGTISSVIMGTNYLGTVASSSQFSNLIEPGIYNEPQDGISLSQADISISGATLTVSCNVAGIGVGNSTLYENKLLVEVKNGITVVQTNELIIPAGYTQNSYSGTISLLPNCADYTVTVTPRLGFIPSCGVSTPSVCQNYFDGTSVTKNHVIVSGPISASAGTITGAAPFLCTGGVQLKASPIGSNFSYSWVNTASPSVVLGTTAYLTVTQVGTYSVTVSDPGNGCTPSSVNVTTSNSINVVCPGAVCPGDRPTIFISDAGSTNQAIVGGYDAQWYNTMGTITTADDELASAGIRTAGDYYVVAIARVDNSLPGCTLTTVNSTCPITMKPTPAAYDIEIVGSENTDYIVFCPGTKDLHVTNPGANSGYQNGHNDLSDLTSVWSNGITGSNDQSVNQSGRYYITTTDNYTGCWNNSNELHLATPYVNIRPVCGDGSSNITLQAYTNFTATNFIWKDETTNTMSPTGSAVTVSNQGLYTINTTYQGCLVTDGFYVTNPILPIHNSGTSSDITNGNFIGLSGSCPNPTIISDLTCLASPTNDPLLSIGTYAINSGSNDLGAALWNPGHWTGTGRGGIYANGSNPGTNNEFMITDGRNTPLNQTLWKQENIAINHGYNYYFRAYVRSLDVLAQFPVKEIPEMHLQILYKDGNGHNLGWRSYSAVIEAVGTIQNPWLEFGLFQTADTKINDDRSWTGQATHMDVSIILTGGGQIGRDIGIDDVELWRIGVCDRLNEVVQDATPCSGVTIDDQIICPGSTANIQINNPNTGTVTYTLRDISGTANDVTLTSTLFTVTPTLTPEHLYQVVVTGSNCTSGVPFKVITNPPPTLTITTGTTPGSCIPVYTAMIDGVENTSLTYVWKINGTTVLNETASVFHPATLVNGDDVSCEVETSFCGGTTTLTSTKVAAVNATLAPTVTTPVSYCQDATATSLTATGTGLKWYTTSTGGTGSITAPVPSTTTVGNTSYYVSQTVNNCESSRTELVVTVKTTPIITSTTPGSSCGNGTVILGATTSAGDVDWYTAPTGGSYGGSGTSFTRTIYYTTTFYAEASYNGCLSSTRAAVDAIWKPIPGIITYDTDVRCGSGNVTLEATSNQGDIDWYSAATGGTYLGTGTSFTRNISATTTYYAEAKYDGCSDTRLAIEATVKPVPEITSTTPASRCGSGEVVLGATSSAGDVDWYTAATGGSYGGSGTSFTRTINSTTTFYAEASYNGCLSPTRTAVVATMNPPECGERKGYLEEELTDEKDQPFRIEMNPNPFTDHTYVTITGTSSLYVRILIVDVNGKIVYENDRFQVNQNLPIGEGLPSGMHLLRVIDVNKIRTEKIIKLK